MPLRYDYDATTIRLRCYYDTVTIPLRYGYDATTIRLRCHYDTITMPLRYGYDATTIRLRCLYDTVMMPLRYGFTDDSTVSHTKSNLHCNSFIYLSKTLFNIILS